MLLLIFIFASINQNVYSLPPINFTDAVLTNRMIEALNSALQSRYEQPIALAPSPSPSLRHQVRQHSINQQQYIEPIPQSPTFSHVQNHLPEQQQQQQQFYYNQINDYQQQPQYPNPISDQEHAFYQQQFIEHQQRQQQYQQQQQQQQQPQQQSSQTSQHYVPPEPQQQQIVHANQQYYPVEPQQPQQPQQPHPQVVSENFVPEHSLPSQPQAQQQQQPPQSQPNEADSRGYYPFHSVNWFNFPSVWPTLTTNQIHPTAALPIVPTQAAAPSADGCPVGHCPTGASCSRDGAQWLCGCGFGGCLGIQNPCGVYGRYYFPYYPDASRFIQCDQTGVFWIRKCAPGTIFDPKIGVCNYPPVVVEVGKK